MVETYVKHRKQSTVILTSSVANLVSVRYGYESTIFRSLATDTNNGKLPA